MTLMSAGSVNKMFQSQVNKGEAALRMHIADLGNERILQENVKSCGVTKEHIFSGIGGGAVETFLRCCIIPLLTSKETAANKRV